MIGAALEAALLVASSVALVASMRFTRAAPWRQSTGAMRTGLSRGTPPGGDRIDGRSPGSRFAARHRLPGCSSGSLVRAFRLQLRGQLRIRNLRSAPHSLFAL